jgi:hypothetical protein
MDSSTLERSGNVAESSRTLRAASITTAVDLGDITLRGDDELIAGRQSSSTFSSDTASRHGLGHIATVTLKVRWSHGTVQFAS